MIKFTLKDSTTDYIYVNPFQIVYFYAARPNGSIIEVVKGDNIYVKETPEEIQKLIEEVIG